MPDEHPVIRTAFDTERSVAGARGPGANVWPMPDKRETERLRAIQKRRQQEEAQAGEQSIDPGERRGHERRADKASYLREKLDEQARRPDE